MNIKITRNLVSSNTCNAQSFCQSLNFRESEERGVQSWCLKSLLNSAPIYIHAYIWSEQLYKSLPSKNSMGKRQKRHRKVNFKIRAAATEKSRSSIVGRGVRGTVRVDVNAKSQRRQLMPGISTFLRRVSDRWLGVVTLRHMYIGDASLKEIHFGACRTGVTWYTISILKISLNVAFITSCSWRV